MIYRGAPRDELVTNGKTIRGYDRQTGRELWTLGPNSEVVVGTPIDLTGDVGVLKPTVRAHYEYCDVSEGALLKRVEDFLRRA